MHLKERIGALTVLACFIALTAAGWWLRSHPGHAPAPVIITDTIGGYDPGNVRMAKYPADSTESSQGKKSRHGKTSSHGSKRGRGSRGLHSPARKTAPPAPQRDMLDDTISPH